MGSRLDDLTVRREHGKNLSDKISETLFPDLIICIEELVSNSHDADAERVSIVYNPISGTLTIEDDGTGMNGEGLQNFYRLGDSQKLEKPVTEKGRRTIGQFGIASLVLKTLARNYTLETWREGVHSSVTEQFANANDDNTLIAVKRRKFDPLQHGTKITIDKLRFRENDRDLDIRELTKRLSVEMPVLPDFAITVNNQEIKPRAIENGVEYRIQETDPVVGPINGSIWYSSQPLSKGTEGIYIKVHGRAVGGSGLDLELGAGLRSRVFGVIHADGLNEIVGFSRDDFVRDHPKALAVKQRIRDTLRSVRQDMEYELKVKERAKAEDFLAEAYTAAGKIIGSFLGGEAYTVCVDQEGPTDKRGEIAWLDRSNKRLYINASSRFFNLQKMREDEVRQTILQAARHALTRELLANNQLDISAKLQLLEKIDLEMQPSRNERAISLVQLLGSEGSGTRRISPARLYENAEAARLLECKPVVVVRMIESGILPVVDGKIKGTSIVGTVKELEGKVSLFEILREAYPEREPVFYSNAEVKAIRNLGSMSDEGTVPAYVSNLSRNQTSFWVVERRYADSFNFFLENNSFPIGFFNQKYSLIPNEKGNDVFAYILELVKPFREQEQLIREALHRELEFTRQADGSFPVGVKTASYVTNYHGRDVICGVITGMPKKIVERLQDHKFTPLSTEIALFNTVYGIVSSQRSSSLPLTSVTKFKPEFAKLVDKVYEMISR